MQSSMPASFCAQLIAPHFVPTRLTNRSWDVLTALPAFINVPRGLDGSAIQTNEGLNLR